jgi:energy-coupling factor transporter ATP-binding protein EcfA2
MIETHSVAPAELRGERGALPPGELEIASILPRQAKTVRDTGLEPRLVTELVVKTLQACGKTPLPVLSGKIKLSINVLREVLSQLMAEQQVEVAWCGDSDIDVQYQLTAPGQRSAADYLAQSRYVGPAPVTLAAYRAVVERQSLRQPGAVRLGRAELAAALAEDGLDPALRDAIGAALHSQRALLLYGPSGSGKTTLARKLGRLLHGAVALPYAILVERHIIQFYDPLLHHVPPPLPRQQEDRRSCDTRWAICQRPVVHVGTNLTRDMLDLRDDPGSGVLRAPPHMLANNGMLIVDDVGRQRLPVAEMLNRWIGPLDAGVDQLSLPGGQAETVPFDATVVFATNLAPDAVFDDAFLRRIGYKVPVGALSEAGYRNLLRRQCRLRGIDIDDEAIDHLVLRLHGQSGRALLASYPHELLGRIADFASFADTRPRLCAASLDQAWHSMFASCATHLPAAPAIQSILSGDQS